MTWCEGGSCFQVIERDGNMPLRLSITQGERRGRRVRVRIAIEADSVSDQVVALMRKRTATMLRADLDLDEFYKLAAAHDRLAAIPRIGAGRLLRSVSISEAVIKTICGTNVNWAQAVKMINRIGQLGPCLKNFRNLNAWPTPAEILAAGEDYLLNVARVGYRCKSIVAFCRAVREGSFDAEGLDAFAASNDSEQLRKRLLSIKGIGPAGAHFLLGQLGHFDRVSVDSWTMTYVSGRYLNGRKPTVKQVEKIYERYGRWRSLVWWFEQWLEWDTARSMLPGRPNMTALQR
ncbi:MAG: hypothetical protein V3W34_18080 [Phycisphaerae bacterium]